MCGLACIGGQTGAHKKRVQETQQFKKSAKKLPGKWPNACHVKFTQSYVQAGVGVVMIHTVPLGMQPLTRTLHSHI